MILITSKAKGEACISSNLGMESPPVCLTKKGAGLKLFFPLVRIANWGEKHKEVVMKSVLVLLVAVGLMVFTSAWAKDSAVPAARFTKATVDQTEKSLVLALESNSVGLRTSAAQTVRDLKVLMPERSFSRLVIPLMRIVKDQDTDGCSRVIAAIALHELRSAVGDFAISREAKFADCPKMRRICNWLTHYRYMEEHPEAPNQVIAVPNALTLKFAE